jgi:cyclic pyranopterin phosphate synthase
VTPLVDPHGRPIKSLRISLTQRCNFNCFFCHHEGEHDSGNELAPEEVERIVSLAASQGVTKVKLTGGEPLVRKDIVEIVQRISPLVDEVSMTTNASKLEKLAYPLKEAGLARVNISLHTLCPESFEEITGNGTEQVTKGIEAAVKAGLNPVKLNMVVMEGVNHTEIDEMIDYSRKVGAILQLIEFQELEDGVEHYGKFHYDLVPVEEELVKRSEKVVEREMHLRKIYHLKDGGRVEVVRPMHNSKFCAYCNRIRVTSDGKLKSCLMRDDNHVPFVSLMREGASEEDILDAFKEAVSRRAPFWRD